MIGYILLLKNGVEWDRSGFQEGNRGSLGVAMQDVLDWRAKILREEPEAKITLEIVL